MFLHYHSLLAAEVGCHVHRIDIFLLSLTTSSNFYMVLHFVMQLDVTSSQLLVTDRDFKDSEFRKQVCETVNSLLGLRVIPVFNENDAISTRRAPYEVCSSFMLPFA